MSKRKTIVRHHSALYAGSPAISTLQKSEQIKIRNFTVGLGIKKVAKQGNALERLSIATCRYTNGYLIPNSPFYP